MQLDENLRCGHSWFLEELWLDFRHVSRQTLFLGESFKTIHPKPSAKNEPGEFAKLNCHEASPENGRRTASCQAVYERPQNGAVGTQKCGPKSIQEAERKNKKASHPKGTATTLAVNP
jgi:hypothetical protein